MLGHVVARHLSEQGCEVAVVQARFTAEKPEAFINEIASADPKWCINCIGVKAGPSVTRDQLFEINALLPRVCAETLKGRINFLQASTDGVFRPDCDGRRVAEESDATDDYGTAKGAAEKSVIRAGGMVMRCSIIGPELGEPHSLFGWLLRQSGEVEGYINHWWNGITTLEWAKVCWELMNRQPGTEGPIIQPGTWPAMSKCEVLRLIGKVWGLAVKVRPAEAKDAVDRTLLPTLKRPDLEHQLSKLRAWYELSKPAGPSRQANAEAAALARPSSV
jgi:dTDP-4-dehydrorhamnose reductase